MNTVIKAAMLNIQSSLSILQNDPASTAEFIAGSV